MLGPFFKYILYTLKRFETQRFCTFLKLHADNIQVGATLAVSPQLI